MMQNQEFDSNCFVQEQEQEHEILRPIQYLGSKLRSLNEIERTISSLKRRPKSALDLFSGSSTVSQLLRKNELIVHANDALKFSSIIANALIGDKVISHEPMALLNYFNFDLNKEELNVLFEKYIAIEKQCLLSGSPDGLIAIYKTIPQLWRTEVGDKSFREILNAISASEGKAAYDHLGLCSFIYAGTYFGVTQAVEIDLIRRRINDLFLSGEISSWENDLMLAALVSTMSTIVFSAGKHFAQPHLIKEGKDDSFVKKRIMKDRSYSVLDLFRGATVRFWNFSNQFKNNGSKSTSLAMESLIKQRNSYDLIYADPPYTAQQYSRFYHIPEVVVKYEIPKMQLVNEKITRGLYPDDKFKSRFCSKAEAPKAFNDMCKFAREMDASLILSYSLSKKNETGNERMVGFEQLVEICRSYYKESEISISEFSHDYRQFNSSSFVNLDKEDKEIQIVCEAK
jgi:adenine-specific DNA-methyltransferase